MFNIFEPLLGVDKDTFLTRLNDMYKKNPRVLSMIETFDLEFKCEALDEKLTSLEIIQTIKNMNTEKFKNEVTDENTKVEFIRLDKQGDNVEGKFKGSQQIDFRDGKGAKEIFQIETKDGLFNLPSNFELSKKLRGLEQKQYKGEVYIERGETIRLENNNTLTKFKVFTE